MRFGENLKTLRKRKKMTQVQLAKSLNVAQSTVGNWESGTREPDIDMIKQIALALDTPVEKFFVDPKQISEKSGSASIPNAIPYAPNQMIPIPVIGRVAAGYTCLAEQYVEGYALADPDSLLDGYDYMWLRVTGDSMEPDIREGDLVLVRLQETADSGDCVVVIVDEEDGLVKRIDFGDDYVSLISNNSSYSPRVFVREEMNRVRIVGKVIELKRMI